MSKKEIKNEISLFNQSSLSKDNPRINKKLKHTDIQNFGSSNLLTEIKSISIPESTKDKRNLLITLKETIMFTDQSIQLLIKKKEYYKELVSNLEVDLQKENEIQIKNKLKNDKLEFIQAELNSKYILNMIIYFYSSAFTINRFLTSPRRIF